MPAMGPSKDHAYQTGRVLADSVLAELKLRGIDIDHLTSAHNEKLFLEQQERVREAIQELVWIYEAGTW